jgi:hypothetical protein
MNNREFAQLSARAHLTAISAGWGTSWEDDEDVNDYLDALEARRADALPVIGKWRRRGVNVWVEYDADSTIETYLLGREAQAVRWAGMLDAVNADVVRMIRAAVRERIG